MSVLESLINEGNQIIMESDHALEIGYEPATEGFFRDDKNPDIKMEDADNKSFTAISYKHKGSTFIGTDWVNVYLSSWKKTTEPFAKSGKKFVTDCVKAICDGEKYVNQHRKEFIDAYNSNNKEVCDNIAQGMRNIFTTSIATIRQENQGGRVFAALQLGLAKVFLLTRQSKSYRINYISFLQVLHWKSSFIVSCLLLI